VARIKAMLFDLYGTLAYVEDPIDETKISEYLFSRGYEVSPQQLKAARAFVSFIDYPNHGYINWRHFLSRMLWRLKVKVDEETLNTVIRLFESRPYQLYPDAAKAVTKAKENDFKTAIVTTIAYFQFKEAIQPIKNYLDFVMTGYEARCDKTNPRMYRKVLEILNLRPEEAVMIGDDLPIDVILPKKLGINAILLNRETKNIDCSQADAVINDLNEAVGTVIRKFGDK
jgi:putative hydrolase of the HAD superfamily